MLKKTPALAPQPCAPAFLALGETAAAEPGPARAVLAPLPRHYGILRGSKQAMNEKSRLPHRKAHFVH